MFKRIFIIVILLSAINYAQTSVYSTRLTTAAGAVVSGGTVSLLPYGNTYPSGKLDLTHQGDGVWQRAGVPTGEYSLYYNGNIIARYSRFWVGENQLSKIAQYHNQSGKLTSAGIVDGAVGWNHVSQAIKDSIALARVQMDNETIEISQGKARLADGAVSSAKVADSSVTLSKLSRAVLNRIDAGGTSINNQPDDETLENVDSTIAIKNSFLRFGGVKHHVSGVQGVESEANVSAISSAVSYFAGNKGEIYFSSGTYYVGSVTIPKNISLKFTNGAKLRVFSPDVLRIEGSIDAPLEQIFEGDGTVSFGGWGGSGFMYINVNDPTVTKVRDVNPEWFGAVANKFDGTAASGNTAALNKALSTKARVVLNGIYEINGTLKVYNSLTGTGINSGIRNTSSTDTLIQTNAAARDSTERWVELGNFRIEDYNGTSKCLIEVGGVGNENVTSGYTLYGNFHDLYILTANGGTGMKVKETHYSKFENIQIQGGNGHGIAAEGGIGLLMERNNANTYQNIQVTDFDTCFYASDCDNNTFVNCGIFPTWWTTQKVGLYLLNSSTNKFINFVSEMTETSNLMTEVFLDCNDSTKGTMDNHFDRLIFFGPVPSTSKMHTRLQIGSDFPNAKVNNTVINSAQFFGGLNWNTLDIKIGSNARDTKIIGATFTEGYRNRYNWADINPVILGDLATTRTTVIPFNSHRRTSTPLAFYQSSNWYEGMIVFNSSGDSTSIGWVCTQEGTINNGASLTNCSTNGSGPVITYSSFNYFKPGMFVTVSAGFPSATAKYQIIAVDDNAKTITLNANSTSIQTGVTVAPYAPRFATLNSGLWTGSFNGGSVTASGNIKGSGNITLNTNPGTYGYKFTRNNTDRWLIRPEGNETGSSAGSNLVFNAFDDAGTIISAPFVLNRASGYATFAGTVEAVTLKLTTIPVYADNAAALAGGLTAGKIYKTAGGQLMIVY